MTEPNPHALTGAYALDALDGAELTAFQAHLAECDSCPTEATELRATATRLFDVMERTPPADLRDRVLYAVNRTPQLPPLPVSLADRRSRGRRRVMAATGGALALAAVAAGAVFIVTGDDIPSADEIVAAADATTIEAVATGGGEGQLTVAPSLDAAVLEVSGLAQPPAGKTYQAWVLEGDNPVPSDTFEPSATGTTTEVLTDADAATGFAVTVEPDGGSPDGKPSTMPLLVFEL